MEMENVQSIVAVILSSDNLDALLETARARVIALECQLAAREDKVEGITKRVELLVQAGIPTSKIVELLSEKKAVVKRQAKDAPTFTSEQKGAVLAFFARFDEREISSARMHKNFDIIPVHCFEDWDEFLTCMKGLVAAGVIGGNGMRGLGSNYWLI